MRSIDDWNKYLDQQEEAVERKAYEPPERRQPAVPPRPTPVEVPRPVDRQRPPVVSVPVEEATPVMVRTPNARPVEIEPRTANLRRSTNLFQKPPHRLVLGRNHSLVLSKRRRSRRFDTKDSKRRAKNCSNGCWTRRFPVGRCQDTKCVSDHRSPIYKLWRIAAHTNCRQPAQISTFGCPDLHGSPTTWTF